MGVKFCEQWTNNTRIHGVIVINWISYSYTLPICMLRIFTVGVKLFSGIIIIWSVVVFRLSFFHAKIKGWKQKIRFLKIDSLLSLKYLYNIYMQQYLTYFIFKKKYIFTKIVRIYFFERFFFSKKRIKSKMLYRYIYMYIHNYCTIIHAKIRYGKSVWNYIYIYIKKQWK